MPQKSDPPKFIVVLGAIGAVYFVFSMFSAHSTDVERTAKREAEKAAVQAENNAKDQLTPALSFRTESGCTQLGEIAANAFTTKVEGHPLKTVLAELKRLGIADPQRRQAAEGVVVAIYGDASVASRAEAYNIAYSACKR